MSAEAEAEKRAAVAEAFGTLPGLSPEKREEVEQAIDQLIRVSRRVPDPHFHCSDRRAEQELRESVGLLQRLRTSLSRMHGVTSIEVNIAIQLRFIRAWERFSAAGRKGSRQTTQVELPIEIVAKVDALIKRTRCRANRSEAIEFLLLDNFDESNATVDLQLSRLQSDLTSAADVFCESQRRATAAGVPKASLMMKPSAKAEYVLDALAVQYERLTGNTPSLTNDVRSRDDGGSGPSGIYFEFAAKVIRALGVKSAWGLTPSLEHYIKKPRSKKAIKTRPPTSGISFAAAPRPRSPVVVRPSPSSRKGEGGEQAGVHGSEAGRVRGQMLD